MTPSLADLWIQLDAVVRAGGSVTFAPDDPEYPQCGALVTVTRICAEPVLGRGRTVADALGAALK